MQSSSTPAKLSVLLSLPAVGTNRHVGKLSAGPYTPQWPAVTNLDAAVTVSTCSAIQPFSSSASDCTTLPGPDYTRKQDAILQAPPPGLLGMHEQPPPAVSSSKWHRPLFSSVNSAMHKHQHRTAHMDPALPLSDAPATLQQQCITASKQPLPSSSKAQAPAFGIRLSHTFPSSRPARAPMSQQLARQAAPATPVIGMLAKDPAANIGGLAANTTPMAAPAQPTSVKSTCAEGVTTKVTPAKATATAAIPAIVTAATAAKDASSLQHKPASKGKKRKLLPECLSIASLFDYDPNQSKMAQNGMKASVNDPVQPEMAKLCSRAAMADPVHMEQTINCTKASVTNAAQSDAVKADHNASAINPAPSEAVQDSSRPPVKEAGSIPPASVQGGPCR